jgi:hypothetical protein
LCYDNSIQFNSIPSSSQLVCCLLTSTLRTIPVDAIVCFRFCEYLIKKINTFVASGERDTRLMGLDGPFVDFPETKRRSQTTILIGYYYFILNRIRILLLLTFIVLRPTHTSTHQQRMRSFHSWLLPRLSYLSLWMGTDVK